MLFNSYIFICFFLIVYMVLVHLKHRPQNLFLLVASYVFYGCWEWRYLGLIVLSTLISYACTLGIGSSRSHGLRRLLLAVGVVSSLGILFVFKYFDFFARSFARVLEAAGMSADPVTLRLLLPIGISFYTFQSLSYTIDVYRGQLKPTKNLFDFALYVAFFPQLVAGPIERASRLLPQIQRPRSITWEKLGEGGWLVLLGYFKKVVLADNVAVIADSVFNHPGQYQGAAVLVGIVAFALQIYGDFSGYSDIARGIARLMGFDLMVNFRRPYFACNPNDFWRRWHISLSSWIRDYLYIPLGGNRGGTGRTFQNLFLTMFLAGLWHGAAWHFVAWGVYHGVLLIAHRSYRKLLERPALAGLRPLLDVVLLRIAVMFALTCMGWIFFRVNGLRELPVLFSSIAEWQWSGGSAALILLFYAGPLLVLHIAQEFSGNQGIVQRLPAYGQLAVCTTFFFLINLCGATGSHEFIYFQF